MPCCKDKPAPSITEGRHISVTGSAQPNDPLVISAETLLEGKDNTLFNIVLDGDGSLESPWRLQVAYAPTHTLNHLPDVDVNGKQDGDTLTWSDRKSVV